MFAEIIALVLSAPVSDGVNRVMKLHCDPNDEYRAYGVQPMDIVLSEARGVVMIVENLRILEATFSSYAVEWRNADGGEFRLDRVSGSLAISSDGSPFANVFVCSKDGPDLKF